MQFNSSKLHINNYILNTILIMPFLLGKYLFSVVKKVQISYYLPYKLVEFFRYPVAYPKKYNNKRKPE